MDLKKKFAVGVCAVALTSMMAAPAFAASGPTTDEYNTLTEKAARANDGTDPTNATGGDVQSQLDITANLVNTTKVVKVEVPTKIAVAFKLDTTGKYTADTGNFIAPTNAQVVNKAESSGKVNVTLASKTDVFGTGGESFFDQAKLTFQGDTAAALDSNTATNHALYTGLMNDSQAHTLGISSAATTGSFAAFMGGDVSVSKSLNLETLFKVTLQP